MAKDFFSSWDNIFYFLCLFNFTNISVSSACVVSIRNSLWRLALGVKSQLDFPYFTQLSARSSAESTFLRRLYFIFSIFINFSSIYGICSIRAQSGPVIRVPTGPTGRLGWNKQVESKQMDFWVQFTIVWRTTQRKRKQNRCLLQN